MKNSSKNGAFTLIEVLVSMIIFSSIIGIASNHIEPVSKQYLVVNNIGTQLALIRKANDFFLNLTLNSNYLKAGNHQIPLDEIVSTKLFNTLKLQIFRSNGSDYIIGKFTSTDFQNQQVNWYVYRF